MKYSLALSNKTAPNKIIPRKNLTQNSPTSIRYNPLLIKVTSIAPSIVPKTVTFPPDKSVPPKTGAKNPLFDLMGTPEKPGPYARGPFAGIKSKFDDIVGGFLAPFKESLKKFTSKASVKAGGNILARGLPFVGAALDFASMVEEAKRGNIAAATFFGLGGASSALSGAAMSTVAFAPLAGPLSAFSFAMSLLGIGASIIEDSMKSRGDTSTVISGRKTGSQRRAEYNLKRNQTPDLSMDKKKNNVKIVLAPTDTGETGTSSGSGATNSDIQEISSVDQGNDSLLSSVSLYGALNYA